MKGIYIYIKYINSLLVVILNEFTGRHWELKIIFGPASFKLHIKSPGMPEGVTMRVRQ